MKNYIYADQIKKIETKLFSPIQK